MMTEDKNVSIHFCHLVSDSVIDHCFNLTSSTVCVKCTVAGKFLTGGVLTDEGSTGAGHVVSMLLWISTMVFGTLGCFANLLIIAVLSNRKNGNAFDLLLTALALMDLTGSITAVMGNTSLICIFENWDRGIMAHGCAYFGMLTCLFARSGSSFMTLLITLERYLIITFPVKSRAWFTPKKTKFMIAAVYLFTLIILSLPRYLSFKVAPNPAMDIPVLKSWTHILTRTSWTSFWYTTMKGFFAKIDYWVPLPLLLLLNILIFIEIRKFSRKRKELKLKNEEKEIRAVRMFVPVVIALFLCNIEPYFYWGFVEHYKIVYRELLLGVFLSVAVNSSVNLPIYYYRGSGFKKEVRSYLSSHFLFRKLKCLRSSGKTGMEERCTGVTDMSSGPSGNSGA